MPKIASKGAVLNVTITATPTAIPHISDMTGPDAEVQTFNASALDSGVGFEYLPTGYAEPGTVSGTLFLDPVAAEHQYLLSLIVTPALNDFGLVFPDSGSTEWTFNGILTAVTPAFDMTDGVKADFSIQLNGLAAYVTS